MVVAPEACLPKVGGCLLDINTFFRSLSAELSNLGVILNFTFSVHSRIKSITQPAFYLRTISRHSLLIPRLKPSSMTLWPLTWTESWPGFFSKAPRQTPVCPEFYRKTSHLQKTLKTHQPNLHLPLDPSPITLEPLNPWNYLPAEIQWDYFKYLFTKVCRTTVTIGM